MKSRELFLNHTRKEKASQRPSRRGNVVLLSAFRPAAFSSSSQTVMSTTKLLRKRVKWSRRIESSFSVAWLQRGEPRPQRSSVGSKAWPLARTRMWTTCEALPQARSSSSRRGKGAEAQDLSRCFRADPRGSCSGKLQFVGIKRRCGCRASFVLHKFPCPCAGFAVRHPGQNCQDNLERRLPHRRAGLFDCGSLPTWRSMQLWPGRAET